MDDNSSSASTTLITDQLKKYDHIVAHKSSQTGDTIHVAGTLALYPHAQVLVIHVGQLAAAENLLKFYKQVIGNNTVTTNGNKRIQIVLVSSVEGADALYAALNVRPGDADSEENKVKKVKAAFEKAFKDITDKKWGPIKREDGTEIGTYDLFMHEYLGNKYQSLGYLGVTTSAIAQVFDEMTLKGMLAPPNPSFPEQSKDARGLERLYAHLAKAFASPTVSLANVFKITDKVPDFEGIQLPGPGKEPIVLLWTRYTGTNTSTGYNPEGDSSIRGQEQLYKLLNNSGYTVITIGHGPRGVGPLKTPFALGEFYTKGQMITIDRSTQISFLLALMGLYPGRLYQIGQKTGGMDSGALLGIPTIYLEWQNRDQYRRMLKWVGKVPFYRNVPISQAASLIGRLENQKDKTREEIPMGGSPQRDDFAKWLNSNNETERTRSLLVRMIFAYPKLVELEKSLVTMGLPKEALFGAELDPKKINMKEEQKKKEKTLSRFKSVVDWVKGSLDNDLRRGDIPANDGKLLQAIHRLNQSTLDNDNVPGYSEGDVKEIRVQMGHLVDEYSNFQDAVIFKDEKYQTREEAFKITKK